METQIITDVYGREIGIFEKILCHFDTFLYLTIYLLRVIADHFQITVFYSMIKGKFGLTNINIV